MKGSSLLILMVLVPGILSQCKEGIGEGPARADSVVASVDSSVDSMEARLGVANLEQSRAAVLFAGANPAGESGGYQPPAGSVSDGKHYFVSDRANHTLSKISPTGDVHILAGTPGSPGSADGIGGSAAFNYPSQLTLVGRDLYLVDTGNHSIRKIDSVTGAVTTLAGSPATGKVNGVGRAASFAYPMGIVADGRAVYIADVGNFQIRRIELTSGEVSTIPRAEFEANQAIKGDRKYFQCLREYRAWCRPAP